MHPDSKSGLEAQWQESYKSHSAEKVPRQYERELKQFTEHLDSFIAFRNKRTVHKSGLAGYLYRLWTETTSSF